MNKRMFLLMFIPTFITACNRSKINHAKLKQIFDYLISPKLRGIKLISLIKYTAKYQAYTTIDELVNWVGLSPIGLAAFQHALKEDRIESLTNNLAQKGDSITLIKDAYVFNIDGDNIMIHVECNIKKIDDNNIEVEILLTSSGSFL